MVDGYGFLCESFSFDCNFKFTSLNHLLDCTLGDCLWCSHSRLWELQFSDFSLAMHFGQYHATARMVLANRKDLAKDLIMAWHPDLLLDYEAGLKRLLLLGHAATRNNPPHYRKREHLCDFFVPKLDKVT
jgi:hypothetical protein